MKETCEHIEEIITLLGQVMPPNPLMPTTSNYSFEPHQGQPIVLKSNSHHEIVKVSSRSVLPSPRQKPSNRRKEISPKVVDPEPEIVLVKKEKCCKCIIS